MLTMRGPDISAYAISEGHMTTPLGRLIRAARKRKGWTQEQLEEISGGRLQQHYISLVERGGTERPRDETLEAFAHYLDIDMADIRSAMGWTIVVEVTDAGIRVPVVGRIPADVGRYTATEGLPVDEVRVLPEEVSGARDPRRLRGLVVTGDCMQAVGILSGDVVIIEPSDGQRPRDRQIVAVRIDGDVTLKRWCVVGEDVELRDGDERAVYRFAADNLSAVTVLGFFITFKPIAPR